MNEKTEKVEGEEGEREKEKTRARNQILSFSKEDSQVEISRGTKSKLVFVRYSLARSLARSSASSSSSSPSLSSSTSSSI